MFITLDEAMTSRLGSGMRILKAPPRRQLVRRVVTRRLNAAYTRDVAFANLMQDLPPTHQAKCCSLFGTKHSHAVWFPALV